LDFFMICIRPRLWQSRCANNTEVCLSANKTGVFYQFLI